MTDRRRIGEDEARELWRRAAELQAASERAEQRLLPVPEEEEGLSLAEIAAVAEGAGIHPDHVRVALAERRLRDAAEIRPDRLPARMLRRVVGEGLDVIEAARTIGAPPERVLESVRRLFPQAPFHLMAEMSIGEDPLRDGVLVYRLGRSSTDASEFAGAMNWADARVVVVTIRPEGEGARLRLRIPLFRRGVNLAFASGAGAGGTWLGLLAGGGLAGALGLSALVAAPVAVAGAAAGLAAFRGLYRGVLRGGEGAVRTLVEAVALDAVVPIASGSAEAGPG